MTEPRKIALVLLIIIAIGVVALVVELLRDAGRFWLALTVASIAILIMALTIQFGHA